MEFEKVSFSYPCSHKPAVENISLAIQQGKRYALIGRNGCGKTTLLRLANGLYRPQKGVIRWRGKQLDYTGPCLRQWRQNVGLVFQNPEQQLVATTVVEDLSYGLCNLGLPPTEVARRVEEALDTFQLREIAHQPVNYLSLGEKKRLALADVMILKPKLLLLDEPMAYLDYVQRAELKTQLYKIHREGTTIVVATHDLDFAYGWADEIIMLDKGRLVSVSF
ncbi:MAG: energy-coupling factor ABC transporter ATP-binding protein [Geminocystis sp.]|nr:energy-coupling factor ABC transporter ATP-binding protein [Geminocystis sp.]HIK36937.1 ABC transporter ATP-binding protein [Geminocystis sp. M7585_C2015_104]